MNGYKFTDRGKIIVVIIIVILLFIVPSAVMAVRAWSAPPSPPPEEPPQSGETIPGSQDDAPPDISDRPLPNGSGLDPIQPPENSRGNVEAGSVDPTPEPSEDQPENGPIELNLSAGTMLFAFAPRLQTSLDAATTTMLGEFLTSPRNTSNAQILVEMPELSDADTTTLISAVLEAFAQHGVSQESLVFLRDQTVVSDRYIEVRLSFYIDPSRK